MLVVVNLVRNILKVFIFYWVNVKKNLVLFYGIGVICFIGKC